MSRDELIGLCQKSELKGRSGNNFLVAQKLEAFSQANGTLIINAVECDPGLVTDIESAKFKYITVGNLITGKAEVFYAKLGESVRDIVRNCFSKTEVEGQNIYCGGGALQCHLAIEQEYINDTTGFIAVGEMPDYEAAGKCKGCKACTKNCPAGVSVFHLVQVSEKAGEKKKVNVAGLHAEKCIGCGACTYGCMAGKDVREIVAWAKTSIIISGTKQ